MKRNEKYTTNKNEILRNKIIWNLNKNNTSKPRQSTIDKYKLVFNNGKWN